MGPIRSFAPFTVLALVAVFLVATFAWPVPNRDEKIVFKDFVDHIWWSAPPGFLMEPCYEFRRTGVDEWWMRCGNWQFFFSPGTKDFTPANEATRTAWQKALDRRGGR